MLPPPGSRAVTGTLARPRRIAGVLAGRCRGVLRRHWLFAVLLGLAAALRAVVQLAYRPALIFPDSERYLQYAQNFLNGHWAPDWLRVSGYSLLLMPAVLTHDLAAVAAVQHLLGLATAVLVYAVAIRFGARRWVAAAAAIPVLFDPLQLDIEQYVLTDVCATFLGVAALVILAWRRGATGAAAPVTAGLLIAAATIIREYDLLVMIPAVLYLVVAVRPGRRFAAAALLLAGFLPPVLGYLGWHAVWYGRFDFVDYDSQFMYGRIAQFADCAGLSLPGYERPLCPRQPPAQRDPNFYMWNPRSPQVTLQAPPGMNKGHIILDFDRRIIEHQPLAYLEAVGEDMLYSFSPVRGDGPEHYPVWYHQFHRYFPTTPDRTATIRAYTGRGPRVDPALAGFLTGYGRAFYVPGPLLAAGLALGLAGAAGLGRAWRRASPAAGPPAGPPAAGPAVAAAHGGRAGPSSRQLRGACLLFAVSAIAVTEVPYLIGNFDWRYEMPQLSLIPVAAVLGALALAGGARDRTPATPATPATSAGAGRRPRRAGTAGKERQGGIVTVRGGTE